MTNKKPRKDPEHGTVFEHTFKGDRYTMLVVMTEDGLRYKVNEELFKSPTAAAKGIVGDQFVNGRRFWHMDT